MQTQVTRVLLVLGIAVWGCDGMSPSQLHSRPSLEGPAILESASSRKTTSEQIARANLDASIEGLRRRIRARPDLKAASELIDLLMLRADFYGTFDDWEEAVQLSDAILQAQSEIPGALLLRARVLNTLHEFDEALPLIARARERQTASGGASAEIEARARHLEASIWLAQGIGSFDELVGRRRALAAAVPTYQHVTSLALALAQAERFEEADAVFRRALESYRDVSPFPFAWVAFQRGVMWSEQAQRPDLGGELYEEALGYLPGYVLANVHLAELDAAGGDLDEAIDRLESLVGSTQDPEPLAVLATLAPTIDRAAMYATKADLAYRELIDRFPAAFAHHRPDAR